MQCAIRPLQRDTKNTDMQHFSDPCDHAPLDWTYKGIPERLLGKTRGEIAALNLPLFDAGVLFPMAVLREDILEANSRWMMKFLGTFNAQLAPHGKTTMSPDLMGRQLRDGAWGLTAATVHHVRAYRRWGAQRILMANQLVGDGEIEWIAGELARDPSFEFFCLVDSVALVEHLAERLAHHAPGRPVNVLLEMGVNGGRAGVRSIEQGVQVALAAASKPQLALCGVETFEGLFLTEPDAERRAERMLLATLDLTRRCDQRKLFDTPTILLSGGGSSMFDLAAGVLSRHELSKPTQVIIRSGCYIAHDDGIYRSLFERFRQRMPMPDELAGGLRPALQVWARVQSKPEPGLMICGLGKRDVGTDIAPPTLLGWLPRGATRMRAVETSCRVQGLNDQHAYVAGDCEQFAVGDLVTFGISHPCTTFDKWRALLTIDERLRITGLVRTYF